MITILLRGSNTFEVFSFEVRSNICLGVVTQCKTQSIISIAYKYRFTMMESKYKIKKLNCRKCNALILIQRPQHLKNNNCKMFYKLQRPPTNLFNFSAIVLFTFLLQQYRYVSRFYSIVYFCFAAIRHINHFGDWATLGVIALLRCYSLTKPTLTKKLIRKRKNVIWIIVVIWIYASLLPLPVYLGVINL